MAYFLDRIDSAPIQNDDLSFPLESWMSNLVDALNENISDMQDFMNFPTGGTYTTTEIATMQTAGELVDGILLYDSTLNVYVGRISGVLVKFTTGTYP